MGSMERQPTTDGSPKKAPVLGTGAVGGNLGEGLMKRQDLENRPAADATLAGAAWAQRACSLTE